MAEWILTFVWCALVLVCMKPWVQRLLVRTKQPGEPWDPEAEIERLEVENNELREALRKTAPCETYRDAPRSSNFAVEELRRDLAKSSGVFVHVNRRDLAVALEELLDEDLCDCPCTGKCRPWVPSPIEQEDFAQPEPGRIES